MNLKATLLPITEVKKKATFNDTFLPKYKRLHHETQGSILERTRVMGKSFELFLIARSAVGIRSRKMFETSSFAAVRVHKVERTDSQPESASAE